MTTCIISLNKVRTSNEICISLLFKAVIIHQAEHAKQLMAERHAGLVLHMKSSDVVGQKNLEYKEASNRNLKALSVKPLWSLAYRFCL